MIYDVLTSQGKLYLYPSALRTILILQVLDAWYRTSSLDLTLLICLIQDKQ